MIKLNNLSFTYCLILSLIIPLSGCGSTAKKQGSTKRPLHDSAPHKIPDLNKIKDAKPNIEPLSKYGNPKKYKVFNKHYTVMNTSKHYKKRGLASWYGTKFHGQRTSSGEPYDMFGMTAAHKTLPLPTYAKVTNVDNGKSVIVKINDRGPFHCNRLIDLSYTAAAKLGILGKGTGHVEVKSIDPRDHGNFKLAKKAEKDLTQAIQNIAKITTKEFPSKINISDKIYLQLGAFSEKKNAEHLIYKINKIARLSAQLLKNSDGSLFKVQIPVKNKMEAETLSKQLARADLPIPVIIIE
ncbi:MAG: rare lipoprotein [Francisellaceae bacterium]|nr:rare lipoprotein [Francisellaceae bacterium]